MADRIDQLLARKKMGDIVLSPQEKKELSDALYGLAPSSARYRDILAALGKPRESAYTSPNTQPDGTQRKVNEATFGGPPTLDFLSHKPDGLADSPYARGSDASGAVTSHQPVNDTGATPSPVDKTFTNFLGGGGLAANSLLDDESLPNQLAEAYSPGDLLEDQPQGYSWSGIAPGQLSEIRNDPRVLANLLAKDVGGAAGTAASLMPYIQGADALAAQGVWGGPTNDDTIFGGPTSDVAALAQIEDLTDLMSQPGMQFINPGETYGRSFERLGNTDFNKYAGDNGQPLSNDDIIEVTNSALMSSASFMTEETAAQLSGRLQQAAVEYKTLLATGDIPGMSYPAYLKSIGADQWVNRGRE